MKSAETAPKRSLLGRAVAIALAQALLLSPAAGCRSTFYRTFEWAPLTEEAIKGPAELPKDIRVTFSDGKSVHLRNAKADYPRLTGMTDVGETLTVDVSEGMKVEYMKEVMKRTVWSGRWVIPIIIIATVPAVLLAFYGLVYYVFFYPHRA
jgi:hypothetical protein